MSYAPAGNVVLFTTNAWGMFALIVTPLSICALAANVAPRPTTRQSDKNNFVKVFIRSPVVLGARPEAYGRLYFQWSWFKANCFTIPIQVRQGSYVRTPERSFRLLLEF